MGKAQHVVITYTNHRGETEERLVRPVAIHFSTSPFHEGEEAGWLMEAFCEERNAQRSFAMKDVSVWREITEDDIDHLKELVAEREAAVPTVSEPPLTGAVEGE